LGKPICIVDAPQRPTSRKLGASHRIAVFIEGGFILRQIGGGIELVKSSCQLAMYRQHIGGDGRHRLELVESVHFDDDPKPFHPAFHMQRGPTIDLERCKAAYAELANVDVGVIAFEGEDLHAVFGVRYLRVPTPQLDLFATLTMICASLLCRDEDDATFHQMVELLSREENVAREGSTARQLKERLRGRDCISSAHWYVTAN
jgi:hypothetical protein